MRRETLALDAETTYDYIRRLEGPNASCPTLRMARRICRVLGASLDEVFPEDRVRRRVRRPGRRASDRLPEAATQGSTK